MIEKRVTRRSTAAQPWVNRVSSFCKVNGEFFKTERWPNHGPTAGQRRFNRGLIVIQLWVNHGSTVAQTLANYMSTVGNPGATAASSGHPPATPPAGAANAPPPAEPAAGAAAAPPPAEPADGAAMADPGQDP